MLKKLRGKLPHIFHKWEGERVVLSRWPLLAGIYIFRCTVCGKEKPWRP